MSCKIKKKKKKIRIKAKLRVASKLSFYKEQNLKSNSQLRPTANNYHPVGHGVKLILVMF